MNRVGTSISTSLLPELSTRTLKNIDRVYVEIRTLIALLNSRTPRFCLALLKVTDVLDSIDRLVILSY
ncbi:hypothetical protein C463_04861 [Halorubrum californiense DSM 19288]|uniref:Uncharacterized protein n=1 Tax=Halorubrum californiense DSM 19288 TaxID=1227465 RepID=M0EE82_9EURY|nr:hypothetical protein C463_04861 [Halorubrum californiense DSM 19288]